MSADVYDIIEDCTTYDSAITKLKGVCIKTPNPIFARYVLAKRKQKQAEPLQTFMHELLILRKDCNFSDVTAEEYRKELVRDAFINGLSSHTIRQRLLENHRLTLDQAFDIASSMNMAVEHSAGYLSGESLSTPPVAMTEARSMLDDERTSCSVTKRKEWNFCGKADRRSHAVSRFKREQLRSYCCLC